MTPDSPPAMPRQNPPSAKSCKSLELMPAVHELTPLTSFRPDH
jgi:hypothetical protein